MGVYDRSNITPTDNFFYTYLKKKLGSLLLILVTVLDSSLSFSLERISQITIEKTHKLYSSVLISFAVSRTSIESITV